MSLIGGIANAIGSLFSGNSAQDAANALAAQQRANTARAAEDAKFKPVGVTTNFGSTNYGYDSSGRLTSAGYTLDPRLQSLQGDLLGAAPGMLGQFTNSVSTTAPMGAGAQSMFSLGNQYLATSPEAQAMKYMTQQQELLAPSRAAAYSNLMTNLQNTGRGGLSVGGGEAGMLATNPELAAYYNAVLQQDRELAARADAGGQQYAQFGANMLSGGGDLLRNMYGTQVASASPFATSMANASNLEAMGADALTKGMGYGQTVTDAAARAGNILASGNNMAAQTQYAADSYSPFGTFLSGVGGALDSLQGGMDLPGMLSSFMGGGFGSGAGMTATPSSAGAAGLKPANYTVQPSLYSSPTNYLSQPAPGYNPIGLQPALSSIWR